MRTKRIRTKPGDVFAAPFDKQEAKYSNEWAGLWKPEENEECFIVQNIGMSEHGSILLVLYDGIYHYSSELENIDVSKLKPLAIANVSSGSFRIGAAKKVSNQLIPEDTPYMIYGLWWRGNYYIEYHDDSGRKLEIVPKELAKDIPRYGLTIAGMSWYVDYFIKNMRFDHLRDDSIDIIKIRKEAAISNFFPEAKNNPNFSIKLHFGTNAVLQDRKSYKSLSK